MDGLRCETTRPLLSAFLDAALGAKEAEQVSAHLARCAACREYLAGLERVDQELEALPAPAPPRGYLEELRSRVAERVAIEPARKSGHGWLWPRLASLAAAALVAVIIIKVIDLNPPGAVRSPRETLEDRERLQGKDSVAGIPPSPPAGKREAEGARAGAGAAMGRSSTTVAEKSAEKIPQGESASEVQQPTGGRADGMLSEQQSSPVLIEYDSEVEIATLRRVERFFDAQRFDEGHALLDSLFAIEDAFAPAESRRRAAPQARALPFATDSAGAETALKLEYGEAKPDFDHGAFDRDPIRRLLAGYARVADRVPRTAHGAEAAARAATLAFQLYRQTGALADCEFARARIAALREGYPENQRTDSLNALETTLPCTARD